MISRSSDRALVRTASVTATPPAAKSRKPEAVQGMHTIIDKIWDAHVVAAVEAAPPLIYIDLHLVHEVTSPQAFDGLRARGVRVRRPDLTFATVDHSIPTTPPGLPVVDQVAAHQVATLEANCEEFGIPCAGRGHPNQGIVHVIGPELGLTRPGMTIVCGDSHTATHGAFGALAFGIGTSEVEMVLATQCLLQRRPKTLRIDVAGRMPPGVSAKDLILAIIARIGVDGGTGHVIEYGGEAVRALSMEQRMTVCNMSIEAGARAGLVAPDDTTIGYLAGRPGAPVDGAWDEAVARWRGLATDEGARFDRQVSFDVRRAGADDHVRHEPRNGRGRRCARSRSRFARGPARAAGAPARAGVHAASSLASRCSGRLSTWSSSAAARTGGCPTFAMPRRSSAAAAWRRASGRSSSPGRSR